jgi:hypothetical protein
VNHRASGRQTDLSQRFLIAWERLLEAIPPGADRLPWLAKATGIPYRSLDFVRHTRNDLAHAKTVVAADRLTSALAVIDEAQRRLESASRLSVRPRPVRSRSWAGAGRGRPVNARAISILAYLGVFTFGALSVWILVVDRRPSVRVQALQATLLGLAALVIQGMGEPRNPILIAGWFATLTIGIAATAIGKPVRLPLLGRVVERRRQA